MPRGAKEEGANAVMGNRRGMGRRSIMEGAKMQIREEKARRPKNTNGINIG